LALAFGAGFLAALAFAGLTGLGAGLVTDLVVFETGLATGLVSTLGLTFNCTTGDRAAGTEGSTGTFCLAWTGATVSFTGAAFTTFSGFLSSGTAWPFTSAARRLEIVLGLA